ncbi:hypothetical protein GCM10020256_49460 [Streptomyces thermocoprophilus]
MMEPDRVAEVDLLQLVEDGGGVVQRPVEVDAVDAGGERVDGDPGERTVGGGESGRHPLYSFGDGAAVVLRREVIEQVRAHVGGPPVGTVRSERGDQLR